MINQVNSGTTFGSTIIPYDDTLIHKYSNSINQYFRRTLEFPKDMEVQKIADRLDFDQVGIVLEKNGVRYIGKDGGVGGADTFLGKIIKKVNPNAKHIDDVKPIEYTGEVIDLNI